jgi:voltage-gated potassium channel
MYESMDEKKHTVTIRLLMLLAFIVVLLLIGMFAFHFLEGWSYSNALYFSAISLMTRGQSNLFPTTVWSVMFTIFYLFIGVCFIVYAITSLLGFYMSYYQERIEKKAMRLLNTFTKKKCPDKKPDKWIVLKRPKKE